MKSYRAASLAASILGLCAVSQGASAATVSIVSQVFTGNAPLVNSRTAASGSGIFSQSATGSIAGVELSPYAFNTGPGAAAAVSGAYSVLGAGGGSGSATYNVNSSSFALLWGSPDPYNQIAFYTAPNGTGSLIDVIGGNTTSYNGSNLACYASTCHDTLFDLVTFAVSNGKIGSVVLADSGAAFEFRLDPPAADPPSATPLPAALQLFAIGICALGLLGWRKKRKSRVSLLGAP